jgi:hypothetical protein
MSTVFNTSGGVVSLPATPLNTLNFSIRGSLGQNQITRNIGNFRTSWDATNGAVQQQFSITYGTPLVLPSGTTGLLVSSVGGGLNLNLTKTTGTPASPVVANYTVYMGQLYLTDDNLSAVTLVNPVAGTTVTGFIAYVPYTFTG